LSTQIVPTEHDAQEEGDAGWPPSVGGEDPSAHHFSTHTPWPTSSSYSAQICVFEHWSVAVQRVPQTQSSPRQMMSSEAEQGSKEQLASPRIAAIASAMDATNFMVSAEASTIFG
jgi:hypothetical protein